MNGEEVNIEETKEMVDAFLNAGFPGIMTVLSGMSNMEQMEDNISFMKNFKPLDKTELATVKKFRKYQKQKSDTVYRLPLLYGRLPEAYFNPRFVCRYECQADISRLERRLLL